MFLDAENTLTKGHSFPLKVQQWKYFSLTW